MVTRAVAELGVGDHYEAKAMTLIAQLDALVDEGEPVISVHRPTQDGVWLIDILFTEDNPEHQARWLELAREMLPDLPAFSIDPLAERDWVAESQKALHPVYSGPFTIHGSHDREKLPPSRYRIEIDAGRAFGTAHHASTAGCLLALYALAKTQPLGVAQDVGTGTGILAIAADRLGATRVFAGDNDPMAVETARRNAKLNHTARPIEVRLAAGPFVEADTVVANILARPLIAMAGRLAASTRKTLILSGLRTRDRRRIRAAYQARGLTLRRQVIIDDWATLTFSRRPIEG